jgi:hypothetical protein
MTREKTETTTKGKQVERNEPHLADTASSPPHHHPNCYCYRYREDDGRSLIASKNSTIQHKTHTSYPFTHTYKRPRKARGR